MHTALSFAVLGEDVLVTGAGPIGCMAVGGRPPRRRAPRRRHRPQPLPARPRAPDGRDARGRPARARPRRRAARARDDARASTSASRCPGTPRRSATMIANMAHGGRIAILGIPAEPVALDLNPVIFNMLTIKGIYGREMYETWYQMSVMLESGLDIKPVITHRFPHRDFEEASPSRAPASPARSSSTGPTSRSGAACTDAEGRARRGRSPSCARQGSTSRELVMTTPQGAHVEVEGRGELLNLCANNYLGLAEPSRRRRGGARRRSTAGATAWRRCGSSAARRRCTASSRSGCPRSSAPRTRSSSRSCFDANGGLFEALLDDEDAVISDALNHASIIDGIRLCKAQRLRYANGDMDELEARLSEAAGARRRLIATDGVFSMDGYLAKLDQICDLAERHDALVMVDDSHAVGFVGPGGRGTPEQYGVDRARRHPHRARSARRSAARAAATSRAGARSSSCSASARGRTSSRTASRRRSSRRASPALDLIERLGRSARPLRANTARFRAR